MRSFLRAPRSLYPISSANIGNKRLYSLRPLSPVENEKDPRYSALKKDQYLHNFLSKVSYTTAAGLAGTAFTSAAVLSLVDASFYSLPLFVGSAVTMLGSAFALDFLKPKFQKNVSMQLNHQGETDEIVLATQPPRIIAMGALSISSGVMLAPLLTIMHEIDPIIIPASACITTCAMAGMIHYAFNTPRSLIEYGPALHIGLWGLIGNGIIGLWLFPNQFSFFVDVFGGKILGYQGSP